MAGTIEHAFGKTTVPAGLTSTARVLLEDQLRGLQISYLHPRCSRLRAREASGWPAMQDLMSVVVGKSRNVFRSPNQSVGCGRVTC